MAINPNALEKTLKKINEFLSSAPDNGRKKTRRGPDEPFHKITYTYTSPFRNVYDALPNSLSIVRPTPSTMHYFGICFVA